jgi:hypothetical protein
VVSVADGGKLKVIKTKVRCDRSINTARNLFFDEMAPKQLGMWVRYINSGLEEGEVNKKCLGKWR